MSKNTELFETYYHIIEDVALYTYMRNDGIVDVSDLIAVGILAMEEVQKMDYNDDEHFSKLLRKAIRWRHADLVRLTRRRMHTLLERKEDVYLQVDAESNERLKEVIYTLSDEAQTIIHQIIEKGIELFDFVGTDTKRSLRGKVRKYITDVYGQNKAHIIISEIKVAFQY